MAEVTVEKKQGLSELGRGLKMLVLVIGGSGSGKSEYAEKRMLEFAGRKKIYLATMESGSTEAKERICRHRKLRESKGFVTVERQRNLKELELEKGADVLLEDLGNLVANELFAEKLPERERRTQEKSLMGLLYLMEQARNLVVVTNDIFSDGVSYEGEMLQYQRLLADCNRFLAGEADEVIEIVCGQPNFLKGRVGEEQ